MGSRQPTNERRIDQDGVVHIEKRRTGNAGWILWMGLGVTVLSLALSAWLVSSPAPVPEGDFEPPMLAQAPPHEEPAPPPPRRPVAKPEAPVVTRQEPAPRPEPQAEPPPPRDVDDSGPKEGLGLYRPGTKPLKQGIIVPEDFELPPGYVRHYQTTDNGQMQRPILMFHPDYTPVDEKGQPVELPENRVVPPELAPPGMPIDVLELPEGPEGVEPIP
jgi:hypothetical protein